MVMVHGFRGDHHGLALLADCLPDTEVYLPELPGFGHSPAFPDAEHTVAHYATAVGSAVNEDANDAQSLTFPIMLPIILAIIIMINSINDPSSSLATWASIIPFTSPVVMMSRIPFGVPDTVPYWELGLSVILLVAGFLATTWLSAKVYRTGILLYGKKPTWKEMMKWIAR